MQRHLPFVSYAIGNGSFEFGGQREHGAKHFARRREGVIRNPFSQLQKLRIEYRCSIEHAENILRLHFWRAIVQPDDHAGHALLAKRNQDAPANHGLHPFRDAVSEGSIERHWKRDVAEVWHASLILDRNKLRWRRSNVPRGTLTHYS